MSDTERDVREWSDEELATALGNLLHELDRSTRGHSAGVEKAKRKAETIMSGALTDNPQRTISSEEFARKLATLANHSDRLDEGEVAEICGELCRHDSALRNALAPRPREAEGERERWWPDDPYGGAEACPTAGCKRGWGHEGECDADPAPEDPERGSEEGYTDEDLEWAFDILLPDEPPVGDIDRVRDYEEKRTALDCIRDRLRSRPSSGDGEAVAAVPSRQTFDGKSLYEYITDEAVERGIHIVPAGTRQAVDQLLDRAAPPEGEEVGDDG